MNLKLIEYTILAGLASTPLMRIIAMDSPDEEDQVAIVSLLGIIYTHMDEEQRNMLLDTIVQRLLAINLKCLDGQNSDNIRRHRQSFRLILEGVSKKYVETLAKQEAA